MGEDYANIKNNLAIIASELHRFKGVFSKPLASLILTSKTNMLANFSGSQRR